MPLLGVLLFARGCSLVVREVDPQFAEALPAGLCHDVVWVLCSSSFLCGILFSTASLTPSFVPDAQTFDPRCGVFGLRSHGRHIRAHHYFGVLFARVHEKC